MSGRVAGDDLRLNPCAARRARTSVANQSEGQTRRACQRGAVTIVAVANGYPTGSSCPGEIRPRATSGAGESVLGPPAGPLPSMPTCSWGGAARHGARHSGASQPSPP